MAIKQSISAIAIALAASLVNAQQRCVPVGPELLSNGGFENSKTSISPWTADPGTVFSVVSPGDDSNNALQLALQKRPNGGEPSFQQAIKPTCNLSHLLTFDYHYTESGSDATPFVIAALEGNSGVTSSKRSTAWTTYQEYFQNTGDILSSNNVEMVLFPSASSTGVQNIQFDNFQIYSAGATYILPNATNQVKNGGFESGKLGPWTTTKGSNLSVIATTETGSKHALQVRPNSGESLIRQTVPTKKGSHYLFLLNLDYPTRNPDVTVALRTNAGSEKSVTGAVDTYFGFQESNLKSQYARRFVAHGPQTLLTVDFLYNIFANQTFPLLVDDIQVLEIVDPSQ